MLITNDVYKQFADYFGNKVPEPYLYLLSKRLSEGHICVDLQDINKEELAAAGVSFNAAADRLKQSELVGYEGDWKPFIICNNRLYLHRYFHYETRVVEKIRELIHAEERHESLNKEKLDDVSEYIKENISDPLVQTTDWQMIAAISAALNDFTIITGGPGTGKTTTVSKILKILFHLNPDLKVALAAPTGKAATRMAESMKNTEVNDPVTKAGFEKLEPATIHRLLEFRGDGIHPKKNKENLLDFDLIVIDETSMVDVALFSKLLEAITPGTKLILLGDRNQLSPVEAGSLFGDLCLSLPEINRFSSGRAALINRFIKTESARIAADDITESTSLLFQHVIELKVSHRFSDEKGIGKLSKAIISGNDVTLSGFYSNKDPDVFVDLDRAPDILKNFAAAYKDFIMEKDISIALKRLSQYRVLCAVREGATGIYAINEKIENYLKSLGILEPSVGYYENRPVIVNKNNYQLGIMNGDIGISRKDDEGMLKVWFESSNPGEPPFSVIPEYIDAAETVFAMTIHKSQGSEFNEVMIVLPTHEDLPLLSRELFYTAVTRAREKVIIQGDEGIIKACIRNRVKSGSGLKDRLG